MNTYRRISIVLVLVLLILATSLVVAQDEESTAIEITFWHAMSGGRIDYIARMVEDFNYTHPGIHVTAEYVGSYRDTYNQTLLAAEQGNAPHVVHIFEVGSQAALDSGVFVPAFEIVSDNPEVLRQEDFVPAFASYYSFDGQFYSFPFNSSNPILYYNADMLEAAGVTVPDPWAGEDLTFEWMLDACEAIVGGGVAESCITWPLHGWFFEQWLAEQGEPLVNNDNGRAGRADDVLLDNEAAVKIFSWWKEMYDNGYYVYSGTLEDWSGSRTIFNSGQSAMLISSTSDVTQAMNWAVEGGFELRTAALPIPAGAERNGTIVGGASLWLTADHPQEELDAALEFALWMSNTENAVRWHKGTGYFPIRLSAVDVLEVENWFGANPPYREAFNQLLETKVNTATAGAVMGTFAETRTIVEEAVVSMFVEGTSAEDALAAADEAADAALADYNSLVE